MQSEEMGSLSVYQGLRELVERQGVCVEELEHAPARSSVEAARLRGSPLSWGAKSLLLKAKSAWVLVAFSAAERLDSRAVRAHLGVSKLRFASPAELKALTGLVPGCVPPFGAPLLPARLLIDEALLLQERVAFTPGLLTRSWWMDPSDYLRCAQPERGRFIRAEESP